MNAQTDYLREMGEAADELGWQIERMAPKKIVLSRGSETLTIKTILLSAEYLRSILKPSGKQKNPDRNATRPQ